jgi:hypothetical protein
MSRKTAIGLLLLVCAALAFLLAIKAVAPLVSGLIFASALVVLGVLSKGFRR